MNAKVTIKPRSGSAERVASEVSEAADNVVIDARGRRLVVEQPDFLTESRIMRAIGEAASNQHYVLAYVMPSVMVVQIDDIKVPWPTTNPQIEAAISRVGREGMVAVLGHIEAKALAAQAKAEEAGNISADAEALKN